MGLTGFNLRRRAIAKVKAVETVKSVDVKEEPKKVIPTPTETKVEDCQLESTPTEKKVTSTRAKKK